MNSSPVITKSIRLAQDESQALRQISEAEHVSEAAMMKKFVLEGIARYRLDQAVAAYRRGEAFADLPVLAGPGSAAARYPGRVSTEYCRAVRCRLHRDTRRVPDRVLIAMPKLASIT